MLVCFGLNVRFDISGYYYWLQMLSFPRSIYGIKRNYTGLFRHVDCGYNCTQSSFSWLVQVSMSMHMSIYLKKYLVYGNMKRETSACDLDLWWSSGWCALQDPSSGQTHLKKAFLLAFNVFNFERIRCGNVTITKWSQYEFHISILHLSRYHFSL